MKPHEKAFEKLPKGFLRRKYEKNPNPQYAHLAEIVGGFGGDVLDVGCASCIMYPLLKDKVTRYVGVDIIQKFLDHAKELYPEIEVRKGSILDLPFPDNAFDTVFYKSVLMHLDPEDVPAAIHETMRVASKRVAIGFRVMPAKEERNVEHEGLYYLIFTKKHIMEIIKPHKKLDSLKIIPSGKYRRSTTAIYLMSLK